jgi:hypothetical protein
VGRIGYRSTLPTNELPASSELGPLVWRNADVGVPVTASGSIAQGVTFSLLALSKGTSLQDKDPVG